MNNDNIPRLSPKRKPTMVATIVGFQEVAVALVAIALIGLSPSTPAQGQSHAPSSNEPSSAQQGPSADSATDTPRDVGPDRATIAELLAIRRQLGGGLSSLFEGEDGDEMFVEALQERDRRRGDDRERQSRRGGDRMPGQPDLLRRPEHQGAPDQPDRFHRPPQHDGGPPWIDHRGAGDRERHPDRDWGRVRQFRDVARRLDQMAAELEEIDAYEESDWLREMAQRLRTSVRRHLANGNGGAPRGRNPRTRSRPGGNARD